MQSLEFLRRVLPAQGVYCVVGISGKAGPIVQDFAASIAEMRPLIMKNMEAGRNVYFALSSFKTDETRKADNAFLTRAMFVDVEETGSFHEAGYETKSEIIKAVTSFCADVDLPSPYMVDSGYGVHLYWPFPEAVESTIWKTVAEGFKELLLQKGLRIDRAVSADAARVLRVPRTLNLKNPDDPRRVQVLHEGSETPFDRFRELVKPYTKTLTPVKNGFELEGTPPKPQRSTLAEALAGNEESVFKKLWARTIEGDGCAQLRHYIENARDQNMEPLWRGFLSIASCCTDRDRAVRNLSKLHPYSLDRAEQKLKDIKGPYSCEKLREQSQKPEACTGCKYKGKIVGPIMLTKELRATPSQMLAYTPASEPSDPKPSEPEEERTKEERLTTLPAEIPPLPAPYVWGPNGVGIYVLEKKTDADGTVQQDYKLITSHNLFFVSMVNYNGVYSMRAMCHNPVEGWKNIFIGGDKMAPDKLKVVLDSAGVPVLDGESKLIAAYMNAVAKNLTYTKKAITVPIHLGWQHETSFIYGETEISHKGTRRVPACPAATNQVKLMQTVGSYERWKEIVGVYAAPESARHLTGFLSGFGSLLMRTQSERGLVVHFGAPSSGTGKSTTLYMINSLWGHPQDMALISSSSTVAIQQFMGVLHDVACTVDEIAQQAKERLRGLVMEVTHGKGKERLDSQGRARENLTSWTSHLVCSSNATLATLMEDQGRNIAPELRRIVDIPMNRVMLLPPEKRRIFEDVKKNYGHAGPEFVRYLVNNPDRVRQVVRYTEQKLERAVEPTSDERFWRAWAVTVLAAIPLAQEAKILEFDCGHAEKFIYELFVRQRTVAVKLRESATEILARYINSFFNQFLIVTDMGGGGGKNALVGFKALADSKFTSKEIKGRLEKVEGSDDAKLFIEEAAFRTWCQHEKRLDSAELLRELSVGRGVRTGRMKRLFADTNLGVDFPLPCVEIEVSLREDIDSLDIPPDGAKPKAS